MIDLFGGFLGGSSGDDARLDFEDLGAMDAALLELAEPPDWLLAVEDVDRVAADLMRAVPELRAREPDLVRVKFKRAHLEDGHWVTLHRLTVRDDGAASPREIDVRGTLLAPSAAIPSASARRVDFDRGEWRAYLPDLRLLVDRQPADVGLPAMPALTDPAAARTTLQTALRHGGSDRSDVTLVAAVPTVVRYREGLRCTIVYALDHPEDAGTLGPAGVVAKVYEGDEGRHTYAAMTELWNSPLRLSNTVRIAEPLAFLPELNVVLQELVPGDISLKDHLKVVFADGLAPGVAALTEVVRKCGRGLAELHTCGAQVGPEVTWDDQIAALRTAMSQLATAVSDTGIAIEPLVRELERTGTRVPAPPLVPTHRSFRPAQVLLDGSDIAFVDFDGYCRAEPGLDLALFRTTLVDLCLRAVEATDGIGGGAAQRERQAHLDGLCATFLAGYEEVAPVDRERLALWDAVTSAKDIVDCWRKIKFEHLDRRMEFLRQRVGLVPAADPEPVRF
jgi:hypothetical protein